MAQKAPTLRQRSHAEKRSAEYSEDRAKKDLQVVRTVFDNVVARRDRDAIYEYWYAAYGLRRKWRRLKRNKGVNVKKITTRLTKGWVSQPGTDDLLRFIISNTASTNVKSSSGRTKLSKLKSKYLTLLNYVYHKKIKTRDVKVFIKEHGGLNFKP